MNNNLPATLIVEDTKPVFLLSALVMGAPVVDRLELDPYQIISDGTRVFVDADNEVSELLKSDY